MAVLGVWHDLRDSVRRLRRQPLVGGSAIAACGLAVGLATTVYSGVAGVLTKPLPFDDPDRLVAIWRSAQGFDYIPLPAPEFLDLRERVQTLTGVAGFTRTGFAVGVRDGLQWADAARVTANWFDVLGVRPVVGRTFTPRDSAPGREKVVVLTEAFWRQTLGADLGIIGSSLLLRSSPAAAPEGYEVIGVVGGAFELSYPTRIGADLYVPRVFTPADRVDQARMNPSLVTIARVGDDVDIEVAAAEVATLMAQMGRDYLATSIPNADTRIWPLHDELVGRTRPVFLLLATGAVILLVIGIANVATLLLAVGDRRTQELTVRLAVGATPARLVRGLLTEYMVLAVIAGGVGILIAVWATPWLQSAAPELWPRLEGIRFDGPVLLFALSLTIGAGLCFSVAPAWVLVRRASARGSLGRSRLVTSGHGARFRSVLIVGEAMLVMVLLAGASLIGHSVWRLTHLDMGFDPADVHVIQVMFPTAADDPSGSAIDRALLDRVRLVPGVRHVSLGSGVPFAWDVLHPVRSADDASHRAVVSAVSGEYFDTLDLRLHEGRLFTAGQDRDPHVAVANRRLETVIGTPLLGQRIEVAGQWREVVGVISDVTEVGRLDADLLRRPGLERLTVDRRARLTPFGG